MPDGLLDISIKVSTDCSSNIEDSLLLMRPNIVDLTDLASMKDHIEGFRNIINIQVASSLHAIAYSTESASDTTVDLTVYRKLSILHCKVHKLRDELLGILSRAVHLQACQRKAR